MSTFIKGSMSEFKFERTKIKIVMYDGNVIEFHKPTTLQAEHLEKRIYKINDEFADSPSRQLAELSELTLVFLDEIGFPRSESVKLEPSHLKQIVDFLIYEKKN